MGRQRLLSLRSVLFRQGVTADMAEREKRKGLASSHRQRGYEGAAESGGGEHTLCVVGFPG